MRKSIDGVILLWLALLAAVFSSSCYAIEEGAYHHDEQQRKDKRIRKHTVPASRVLRGRSRSLQSGKGKGGKGGGGSNGRSFSGDFPDCQGFLPERIPPIPFVNCIPIGGNIGRSGSGSKSKSKSKGKGKGGGRDRREKRLGMDVIIFQRGLRRRRMPMNGATRVRGRNGLGREKKKMADGDDEQLWLFEDRNDGMEDRNAGMGMGARGGGMTGANDQPGLVQVQDRNDGMGMGARGGGMMGGGDGQPALVQVQDRNDGMGARGRGMMGGNQLGQVQVHDRNDGNGGGGGGVMSRDTQPGLVQVQAQDRNGSGGRGRRRMMGGDGLIQDRNGLGLGRGRRMRGRLPCCPLDAPTFFPTVLPSFTPLPSITPYPSFTPLPSFTPFPTDDGPGPRPRPTPSPNQGPTVSNAPSTRPSSSNAPSVSKAPSGAPSIPTTSAPTPTTATVPITVRSNFAMNYFFGMANDVDRDLTTAEYAELRTLMNEFYTTEFQADAAFSGDFFSYDTIFTNMVYTAGNFNSGQGPNIALAFDANFQFVPGSTISAAQVLLKMESLDYMMFITDYLMRNPATQLNQVQSVLFTGSV